MKKQRATFPRQKEDSHMIRLAGAILTLGLTALFTGLPGYADAITLSLIPPSGDVAGPAGWTVGWGYTLTNNSPDWLQPENLSVDVFQNGTPNNIFDFPAVAPLSSVSLDFSLVATASCTFPPCGLYELTWDNGAPAGFTNTGSFTISSEFFDQNPTNPGATDLGPAPDIRAAYTAMVSSPTSAVPEPAPFWLLGLSLCVLGTANALKGCINSTGKR